jgi:hypothetical protein
MKLGQLVIELAANTARLQGDLGKAVGMAERAAAGMQKAFSFTTAGIGGGLIGAALLGAAKRAVSFGDELQKAATKAGVSSRAMSEFAYAAKLADVDLGSFSTALKNMQVHLSEAGTGSKQAQAVFATLGLTFDQLQKRKPEAQFELIADRIYKLTDPADKARVATELFGRAGADLLPLFEQGAAGIAKATAEARKLGYSFSDDTLKKLGDVDDATKRLTASWEAFAAVMTSKAGPSLSSFLDGLAGIDTRSTGEKIKDIQDTIAAARNGWVLPGGVPDAGKFEAQLANLRGLQELERVRASQTGTSGGPTSRNGDADGNAAAIALARAAADAKRQAEQTADIVVKSSKTSTDAVTDLYSKWRSEVLATSDLETQAYYSRVAKLDELAKAGQISAQEYGRGFTEALDDVLSEVPIKVKKVAVDAAKPFEATANVFRDSFLNAIDELIYTGDFKFGRFLEGIAADLARASIVNAFSNPGKGSKSGTDWGSILGNFVGSLFGGSNIDGKASGGDVNAGQTYLIGEKGMELFRPRTSGTIIPNHALAGGGVTIAPVYNIDARGHEDSIRNALPGIMRENTRQIYDDLDRRGYLRRR